MITAAPLLDDEEDEEPGWRFDLVNSSTPSAPRTRFSV